MHIRTGGLQIVTWKIEEIEWSMFKPPPLSELIKGRIPTSTAFNFLFVQKKLSDLVGYGGVGPFTAGMGPAAAAKWTTQGLRGP